MDKFNFLHLQRFKPIDFEKDYKVALEKAKAENKALFIMVSSKSCPECNFMKKHVFTNNDVSNYVKNNYVAFEFDVSDKSIPKQMEFWGIPRFYFSNDGENVLKKKMGGMKKEQFMSFIEKETK